MYSVKIHETNLEMKEFKGQRVVTLSDVDLCHQRPRGTARRNFNTNQKHFILNEDYFVRNSYEAKKRIWRYCSEWFNLNHWNRLSNVSQIIYRWFGMERATWVG